jgi:hypothetical protein
MEKSPRHLDSLLKLCSRPIERLLEDVRAYRPHPHRQLDNLRQQKIPCSQVQQVYDESVV